jgi:hypothetical protein
MTGKYSPQYFCVCCGAKLPGTRQELIARGAATIQGNGQILFHCNAGRHTHEAIQKAIHATPTFLPASQYRKSIINSHQ